MRAGLLASTVTAGQNPARRISDDTGDRSLSMGKRRHQGHAHKSPHKQAKRTAHQSLLENVEESGDFGPPWMGRQSPI
jgi:hypothetical protein